MNPETTIRELFELPEQVRKGDFVHKLTEGVANGEETAESYVPTPALADAFDRALTLVGSAVRDGKSHAAYLHGSFGSGKSHFMAMLSLLLADHPAAWRKGELQGLRKKHEGVLGKKLLELHFHMIDKRSIEEAVLGGYVEHVRAHHPEAPVPAVFADEELFENAEAMRAELGDEKFFAKMGGGEDEGWGDMSEGAWDRARFDAARTGADRAEREALFDALAGSWFSSFASTSRSFVDFDRGLSVISCHARELGYEGIVLFLDELILWMSQRGANTAFLQEQVGKMVKLVESQIAPRPAPIVSFIARQRDLAAMVGEKLVGTEEQALRDALKHWDGRFDTITLEDKNLPAIVEKRLLRPASDDAKQLLDSSFDRMRRALGPAWDTLLGAEDAEAFKKLYPFSPTLVEALIALSNSLQRERTAIKLLLELLVEHVGDYRLGQVVAIGDLYDVLAGGEEPADGVMRSRFRMAKQFYRDELLPIIREQRGTDSPERCQRLRPEHKLSLGCSGCAEARCRADNRLAKTLLIAALVPEVRPLKELTASRLVQLNHGSIKSSIPGNEGPTATKTLREWASKLGQITVGNESDPRVRLVLDDVSVSPILDAAKSADTPGARKKVIFDLLFDALGIEERPSNDLEWRREYHGIERRGHIRFGNVRQLSESSLAVAEGAKFRLVIDFPFDEPGYGPGDDLRVVEKFREGGGDYTLVWLPSFFSAELEREIGQVAIIDAVVGSRDGLDRYLGDMAPEQRERAKMLLDNLRQQKAARLQTALQQAYGIARDDGGVLDTGRSLDEHLHFLRPGEQWRRPPVSSFRDAIGNYLDALLEARYPSQPNLSGHKITRARVDKLVERFGEVVDAENKRLTVDRDVQRELAGTLAPLGLVRVVEGAAIYEDRTVGRIQRALESEGLDRPTAGQVRERIDPAGRMGLTAEIEELVVRCFARATARTFSRDGKPVRPSAKSPLLDDDLLEKPDLPSLHEWGAARDLAGALFGLGGVGKALHADNLQRFIEELDAKVADVAADAAALPRLLGARLAALGIATSDRLVTAESGAALSALLTSGNARQKVEALARFQPERSTEGLAVNLKRAAEIRGALADDVVFGAFQSLLSRVEGHPDAQAIAEAKVLAPLRDLLVLDEIQKPLVSELRALATAAQRIPEGPKAPPREPPQPPRGGRVAVVRVAKQSIPAKEGLAVAEDALASVRAELEAAGPGAVLSFTITLEKDEG